MVYSRYLVFMCIVHLTFAYVHGTNSRWQIPPFIGKYYNDIVSGKNTYHKSDSDEVVESSDENKRSPTAKLTKKMHGSLPCLCDVEWCYCCVKVEKLHKFKYQEKDCIILKAKPDDGDSDADDSTNTGQIVKKSSVSEGFTFSAPPLCLPFPLMPILAACVTLDHLMVDGSNIKACVALSLKFTLIGDSLWNMNIRFGCVRLGFGGISFFRRPRSSLTKERLQ